jgi:hypothetical protein
MAGNPSGMMEENPDAMPGNPEEMDKPQEE